MGLADEQFVCSHSISTSLRCPICRDVLEDPVFCAGRPCQCTFCSVCFQELLQADGAEGTQARCPIDRHLLLVSGLTSQRFLVAVLHLACARVLLGWPAGCAHLDCSTGHEDHCLARKVQALESAAQEQEAKSNVLMSTAVDLGEIVRVREARILSLEEALQAKGDGEDNLQCRMAEQTPPIEEWMLVAGLGGGSGEQILAAGQLYYLLCSTWYRKWLAWANPTSTAALLVKSTCADVREHNLRAVKRGHFSSIASARPGAIDNSQLGLRRWSPGALESCGAGVLRPGLREGVDFVAVLPEVWRLLWRWYGRAGGPVLKRRAVRLLDGSVDLELYDGVHLSVFRSASREASPLHVFESRAASVSDLKTHLCDELGLDEDKVRLWDFFNRKRYESLDGFLGQTLEACRLFEGNPILLEERLPDGSWPEVPKEEQQQQQQQQQQQRPRQTSAFRAAAGPSAPVAAAALPPRRLAIAVAVQGACSC